MKLCINCDTENALDAVFCSECGMSLMQAPTGEEAMKVKRAFQAESRPEGSRPQPKRRVPATYKVLGPLGGLLISTAVCVLFGLSQEAVETFPEWVSSNPSAACLQMVLIFGTLLAFAAFMAWRAAEGLGAEVAEMWDRMTTSREASREAHRLGADMVRRHLTGLELSKADLEGVNAEGANLEGAILPEASLVGANLREANLSRANLEGSDLSNANLLRANVQDANLEGANLRAAYLYDANLRGAALKHANLAQADLRYANLTGANLEGALLTGATLDRTTVMPQGWRTSSPAVQRKSQTSKGFGRLCPQAGRR